MEILATVEYTGLYVFSIIFLSLFTIIFIGLTIVGIVDVIENGVTASSVIVTIICIVLSTHFIWIIYSGIQEGVPKEYKAKVTDFNEVYDKGYEIIDQEGKLYILKKK